MEISKVNRIAQRIRFSHLDGFSKCGHQAVWQSCKKLLQGDFIEYIIWIGKSQPAGREQCNSSSFRIQQTKFAGGSPARIIVTAKFTGSGNKQGQLIKIIKIVDHFNINHALSGKTDFPAMP